MMVKPPPGVKPNKTHILHPPVIQVLIVITIASLAGRGTPSNSNSVSVHSNAMAYERFKLTKAELCTRLGKKHPHCCRLEIVFTIAAPAFDILFIGGVLNTKIAHTTAEILTFGAFY